MRHCATINHPSCVILVSWCYETGSRQRETEQRGLKRPDCAPLPQTVPPATSFSFSDSICEDLMVSVTFMSYPRHDSLPLAPVPPLGSHSPWVVCKFGRQDATHASTMSTVVLIAPGRGFLDVSDICVTN